MEEKIKKLNKLYLGGKWVDSKSNKWLDIVNPATEEVLQRVPEATDQEVDEAVKLGRATFDNTAGAWRSLTGTQRGAILKKISDKITAAKLEMAQLECVNNGKPFKEAIGDMEDVAECFAYFSKLAEDLDSKNTRPITLAPSKAESFAASVTHAPIGVIGAIIPWNYPLLMAAWKLAPALAAGCCIVIKPSEYTPLSLLYLGDILSASGLPDGVVSIVTGAGTVGAALSRHPGVDKLAFTGSVRTGREVFLAGGQRNCFHTSLELGGKSSIIVFKDSIVGNDEKIDEANFEKVIEWILFGCFFTNGQICSATSRCLIEENVYQIVVERLIKRANEIAVKDMEQDMRSRISKPEDNPDDFGFMGPLVSKRQYDTVLNFVDAGIKEGAKLLCGGKRPKRFSKGFYLPPTIFGNVSTSMKIWNEEIFGPVLCVMPFKDESDGIKKSNETEYGLAAAVMSTNKERCQRVTKLLNAGIVWINCSQPCFVELPWGGMKRSGSGHRELGSWGLENFMEVKQVLEYVTPKPLGWYWNHNKTKL